MLIVAGIILAQAVNIKKDQGHLVDIGPVHLKSFKVMVGIFYHLLHRVTRVTAHGLYVSILAIFLSLHLTPTSAAFEMQIRFLVLLF